MADESVHPVPCVLLLSTLSAENQMRFRFVLHLQQIIHPASVKMASLDQYCPASQFQQLVGGGLHRLLSVDADSGEHLCFAQVGG